MALRQETPAGTDIESGPSGDGGASRLQRDVEHAAMVSRRGLLWRIGLTTATGVAALTALDRHRAEAATGGNFILGQNNTADVTTEIHYTAPSTLSFSPVLHVNGTAMNSTGTSLVATGPAGGAAFAASGSSTASTVGLAINGTGTGTANGIFGGSGSGTGVSGNSTSGTGVYGNSPSGKGVWGNTTGGHAVHGSAASNGYAGYFAGKVFTNKYLEMQEVSAPAAPGTNKARLFVRDNGSGNTQLCVRFHNGVIRVLATA